MDNMAFVDEHFTQILYIVLCLVFAGGAYMLVYSWIFYKAIGDCISKAYDKGLSEEDYDKLIDEIQEQRRKAEKFPYSPMLGLISSGEKLIRLKRNQLKLKQEQRNT